MKNKLLVVAVLASLSGAAAAQPIYSAQDTMRTQQVQLGRVLQVSHEAIKQESTGATNFMVTGAATTIGALVGAQVLRDSSGRDNGLGQVIGTVAGGVAGNMAANAITSQPSVGQGVNVMVKLDDGRTFFVLMPVSEGRGFVAGQRVALASSGGRDRLISIDE